MLKNETLLYIQNSDFELYKTSACFEKRTPHLFSFDPCQMKAQTSRTLFKFRNNWREVADLLHDSV